MKFILIYFNFHFIDIFLIYFGLLIYNEIYRQKGDMDDRI